MESINKKIIALVPVKNEGWILPIFTENILNVADHLIILDDGSTVGSLTNLINEKVTVIKSDDPNFNMSDKRKILLQKSRELEGTHLIWLDADEIFSIDFQRAGREIILKLKPGEKISMRWIHVWKNNQQYLDDKKSVFGYTWKDFIVCDDGTMDFPNKIISENRTPGSNERTIVLPDNLGVVMHLQFMDWNSVMMKQAWYRCIELIKSNRNPKKINNTYRVTEDRNYSTKDLPSKWIGNIKLPEKRESDIHQKYIMDLFDQYGVETFEPLDIWNIPSIKNIFESKFNRSPKVRKYPFFLILMNDLKNKIYAKIRK